MRINNKILSIPPHISTTWANIISLRLNNSILEINLTGGKCIQIEQLPEATIEAIFEAHANYMESQEQIKQTTPSLKESFPFEMDIPIKMGFSTIDKLGLSNEHLGTALQHNPAHAHAPDLPPEILNKITAIAQIIPPETGADLPKPEPHCNCLHCQITRAIHQSLDGNKPNSDDQQQQPSQGQNEQEELVTDEDLHFCQWDITQIGDKLFNVINRLDHYEKYSVFLGDPVGCTCGQPGCEHILAVLKS